MTNPLSWFLAGKKGRSQPDSEAALEQALTNQAGSIRALPAAAARFPIAQGLFGRQALIGPRLQLAWQLFAFPYFQRMRQDIITSLRSVAQNPVQPETRVSPALLAEFEASAQALGVGAIGYTRLPRQAIFQGKAVLFDRVIVLTMEMDAAKIAKAPSIVTYRMVMKTYYDLGRTVNRLVDFWRQHRFAAQAGHPLNGVALYPLLGQQAGLGWCGSHGLLVSPEFGSRQRLAAIYVGIDNLPLAQDNEHEWIADLCRRCGQCIRQCPSQAIYQEPVCRPAGLISHVDADRCFPVFARQFGCSICVKVCPFSRHPYERIKDAFSRRSRRRDALTSSSVRPGQIAAHGNAGSDGLSIGQRQNEMV
jgi:epoxyqueuosine reductase